MTAARGGPTWRTDRSVKSSQSFLSANLRPSVCIFIPLSLAILYDFQPVWSNGLEVIQTLNSNCVLNLFNSIQFKYFIVCNYIVLISGAMSVFHNFCTYGLLFCIALFCTACFIFVQIKKTKNNNHSYFYFLGAACILLLYSLCFYIIWPVTCVTYLPKLPVQFAWWLRQYNLTIYWRDIGSFIFKKNTLNFFDRCR